ncbi:MAG: hypothetical protein HY903_07510 [Deltaproteobacteria bacterium]|nr:hypothetical protein [Deltaproteobacteria bacterium]
MSGRALTLIAAAALGGCASATKTAALYHDASRHELGAYYDALALATDPKSADKRVAVQQGIEKALQVVGAEYDDRMQQNHGSAALAAATRKDELLNLALALDLKELAALSAKPELEKAYPKAAKESLAAVDDAAARGRPDTEITALLRVALAIDPDDAELAMRYDRARRALLKNVVVRAECDIQTALVCDTFAARLTALVTRENRELTEVATPASKTKNAELVIRLTTRREYQPFQVTNQGRVQSRVPRLDRFKEQVKSPSGEKQYDSVEASYVAYAAHSRAELVGSIEIRALTEAKTVLFARQIRETPEDRRTYVTWDGDERALADLSRLGTDQTPPINPEVLLNRAVDAAAGAAAHELVLKMEGPTS